MEIDLNKFFYGASIVCLIFLISFCILTCDKNKQIEIDQPISVRIEFPEVKFPDLSDAIEYVENNND